MITSRRLDYNNTKKQIQSEETRVSYYKWDEIKDNVDENSLSHCHQAPMIWLGKNSKEEVGICSKCRKLAFNNAKKGKLNGNHVQNFVETRFMNSMSQFKYKKGLNTQRAKS
tara:strand:+ start:1468 stop:1803 length:336 start_codon:yes stop_codon:yes gene_type:complete